MSLELSVTADRLLKQTNIEQNIILEIDGIPCIFGAVKSTKFWQVGNDITIGQPGLIIGGLIDDENSKPWVSLKGTTSNISQQLEPDKGGSGSISRFQVELVDVGQGVTKLFQPGVNVSDILSREANIYVSFQGGAFPEDAIKIFNGIVTSQEANQGVWRIGIDHPEFLKRQDIFTQITDELDGAITSGATSLILNNADGLLLPQDVVRTAVLIDEEVIEYTGIDFGTNTLTGLIRGSFDTLANAHDDEAEISSFYILEGKPLDLSLKIMLSRKAGSNAYASDIESTRFVQVDALTNTPDGIFFPSFRIQEELNITVGDLVTVTGAAQAANNVTEVPITGFQAISTGTVIIVGGSGLVSEIDSNAVTSFRSQYDVLPDGAGCNMKPSQVDIQQHLDLARLFASGQPDYLFYLKETISPKDFLSDEIYFPAGYYRVDRKGRASIATTIPPLVLSELPEFNQDAIKNAATIKMKRQISKNFYNSVVYRYNPDSLDDKFKSGQVFLSQRSVNRIDTGTKTLTIESQGLRGDDVTSNFIRTQARRFSDRYQFAAESVDVEVKFKDGFKSEIADIILFGSPELQIADTERGTRNYTPTLYEIINKSMNLKTGDIKFKLLNTGFGVDGRFGVISPSSFIGSGSTTTQIVVKRSFATGEFEIEREKWTNFIGEEIEIRTADFAFIEKVTLKEFDPTNSSRVIVDPPLSIAPTEDMMMDLPEYPDNADASVNSKMKTIHCFFDPRVTITASVDNLTFEVGAGDIDKFFVNSFVRVHSEDFSDDSVVNIDDDDAVVTVVDTVLNRVTVDRDLTFTPVGGDFVDLIGFKDLGLPYRLI